MVYSILKFRISPEKRRCRHKTPEVVGNSSLYGLEKDCPICFAGLTIGPVIREAFWTSATF
jgi:hypothetical protein